MSRYFSVSVMGLYRLISAVFWAWLWLVSLYQLRLYSEPESLSMEILQKKVASVPSKAVNTAGKMVTIWERGNKEQAGLQQAQVPETAIPLCGSQGCKPSPHHPTLWDMGRYISPCLSHSKCAPAAWRGGTLRGSNCTVNCFQQTKLCSGVPKINSEHL